MLKKHIALSSAQPKDVSSLRNDQTEDLKSICSKLTRYRKEQREFVDSVMKMKVLEVVGFNTTPNCSSTSDSLMVHKTGPHRFRFTVDMRPINNYTIPHNYQNPNIETVLTNRTGSRYGSYCIYAPTGSCALNHSILG